MRTRTLIAVAVVLLAAAACGGGDDDEASAGAASIAVEAAATTTTSAAEAAPKIQIQVPKRPIGPGDQGQRVAELQRALTALGFDPGKPDGIYGKKTRQAVIAFQKRHRLEGDGLVGARTAKAINRELAKLGS